MRGWLLDTNVVSELRRPTPNAQLQRFIALQDAKHLFLSEITFAEIRFGIARLDDPGRRADLERWLEQTLRPLFAGRILPATETVFLRWRVLVEEGRKRGHTFGQPDLFIAAIAALENLIVVSRDISQFREARTPVLDPWRATFISGDGAETSVTLEDPNLLDMLRPPRS